MKNNKKSPLTLARQAKWIEEYGANFKTVTAPTQEFNELVKELIGVDTNEMKQNRIAHESTAQGYRENYKPGEVSYKQKTHSRTGVVYSPSFVSDEIGSPIHIGQDCDLELNEIEQEIVKSSGHNVNLSVTGLKIDETPKEFRFNH